MRIPVAILAFVLVSDFDFALPEELIAQEPLADRASSRMLVLHRNKKTWEDRRFQEFANFVGEGDCLVLNDSKVFPSRLFGQRSGGTARIEVFLIEPLSEDSCTWRALVRPGRKVPIGERIRFSDALDCEILERGDHGERILRFTACQDLYGALDEIGHVPLPPYIRRADRPDDRIRYNTVFAASRGSVAAPTAGLHFTPEILQQCRAREASIARVTLHVGLGTFAPLHAERVEDVKLHPERYSVDESTLETIRNARRRICVGTTTVRTLETVYQTDQRHGETDIFIAPGFQFRAVDAMLTNFHLPASSLLMLVAAFAGRDLLLQAYRHAIIQRYRFYSYGDCMLIL